jgi:hypothetical protein
MGVGVSNPISANALRISWFKPLSLNDFIIKSFSFDVEDDEFTKYVNSQKVKFTADFIEVGYILQGVLLTESF